MSVQLLSGDCVSVLSELEANKFEAVITDPPYHLKSARFGSKGFMAQIWDGGEVSFKKETWEAILRVAKPGAHLLVFGGSRTFHRIACAIEDAGWELRDCLMWLYSQGMPKSLNLHEEWEGYGTALKPAYEPIIMARKPMDGTVLNNLETHGSGALNVDASRLGVRERTEYGLANSKRTKKNTYSAPSESADFDSSKGRWPANVLHDGTDEILEEFEKYGNVGGGDKRGKCSGKRPSGFLNVGAENGDSRPCSRVYDDKGSPARFFYCAKATTAERGEANNHPTVKPLALMSYLVRLIGCKAGGSVLDPFCGSGTTGIAAVTAGYDFFGVDLSPDYIRIAQKRIDSAQGER